LTDHPIIASAYLPKKLVIAAGTLFESTMDRMPHRSSWHRFVGTEAKDTDIKIASSQLDPTCSFHLHLMAKS
jgi:hypothetical protein